MGDAASVPCVSAVAVGVGDVGGGGDAVDAAAAVVDVVVAADGDFALCSSLCASAALDPLSCPYPYLVHAPYLWSHPLLVPLCL